MTNLHCSRSKFLGAAVFLALGFSGQTVGAAEGLQKLRIAYAAITAAFALPWMATDAVSRPISPTPPVVPAM